MTEKRFRVEKQIFDGYCIVDNHFEGYYAYEKQDLEKLCETLNDLNEENEKLKKVLGTILLEVKQEISNTNQTGEIKVFINPNSFDLISEVLRKYGALKGWYE